SWSLVPAACTGDEATSRRIRNLPVAFPRACAQHCKYATMRWHMNDRIEKRIELAAPVSRVWRALTDHREFGEWFRVELEAPFAPGQESRGHITYPGYEHIQWRAVVRDMVPERLFSFTWHPYAIEPGVDYSGEPPTL